MSRMVLGVSCLIVGLLVTPVCAGVVAPGSTVAGKSIGEWTGDWWNWLVQEEFATNPALDTTGALANRNQSGPVFFVAGTFGDNVPYNRSFTVPTDRYILIPMINYVFWAPEDGADEAAIRDIAKANVDSVDSLFFSLDGNPLANPFSYREASPAGGFTLKFAPLLAEIGLSNMDRLAVADGYWVMLEPLSYGTHQLHFGARQPGQFETDVTVEINAVPEPTTLSVAFGCLTLGFCVCRNRRSRRAASLTE